MLSYVVLFKLLGLLHKFIDVTFVLLFSPFLFPRSSTLDLVEGLWEIRRTQTRVPRGFSFPFVEQSLAEG